jgi:hypothetical protein
VTDVTTAAESPAAPLTGWRRRRDIAGQVLELSAHVLRPGARAEAEPGRLQRAASIAVSFLPHSVDSRRSIWSVRSMYSGASVTSIGSFGSILSAGSAGSILSIGSAGSILSIGSVGSVLSIGSAGSMLSIGGLGRTSGPWARSTEGVATVRHLGTVAGSLALVGALVSSS